MNMRLNKNFQEATIEIFKTIFTSEQIEKMIQIEKSEFDNILNLPVDKYFEKQFKITDAINEDGNENSEIIEQNEIILASYTTMYNNSPGKIIFYKNNIMLYINSLINSYFTTPIGLNVALYIHYFVMSDLLMHEGFHHYCDVKRQLTGSKFDINIEDRLAVAHSYNQFSIPLVRRIFNIEYIYVYDKFLNLSYNKQLFRKISNQNRILFDFLMTEHFMSYQSADYKNWQLFTHRNAYKTHFYDYVKNAKLDELLNLGINVNDIAKEINLMGLKVRN